MFGETQRQNGRLWAAIVAAGMLPVGSTAWAVTFTDGFGDADRDNNGAIEPFDVDVDLDDTIDPEEVSMATDAGDVGIKWYATRGFTGSNDGDPKPNAKIIDDSAGIGSGLALGAEAKGSGSSMAGFFGQSVQIGPNVGDKVVAEFDFRIWTESNNPSPPPANGELRWGLFQDTDNQLGQTADVGKENTTAVWGGDDGLWRESDPGPVGDKGIWARIPIGALSDPLDARINYENNAERFLEGSSVGNGGDQDTVASPEGDGPGGRIGADLADDPMNQVPTMPHRLRLEIERTDTSVLVSSFIDGVLVLSDEIDPNDPDVMVLGAPPDSFDYIALRNTGSNGDWDYIIDNVSIVPEPASLILLAPLAAFAARRRR